MAARPPGGGGIPVVGLLRFVFLVLCFCLAGWEGARADTVLVVLSEGGGVYEEFHDALGQALAGRYTLKLNTLAGGREHLEEETPAPTLVVTVGTQALKAALSNRFLGGVPILAALIPRTTFERMVTPDIRAGRAPVAAVWLDQPVSRQLQLIKRVLPGKNRIGVLMGPDSATALPRLKAAASRLGFELLTEQVNDETAVLPALSRTLPGVDALLALPDGLIYSREMVRPVLLTTYRYQKPVFGFSQGYVTAGALSAVYSTPAQIGRQVGEWLRGLPGGRITLLESRYPSLFSVGVNRSVARSFGLDALDESRLKSAIEGVEASEGVSEK